MNKIMKKREKFHNLFDLSPRGTLSHSVDTDISKQQNHFLTVAFKNS